MCVASVPGPRRARKGGGNGVSTNERRGPDDFAIRINEIIIKREEEDF